MMRPQQPLNSVPVNQNANRMSLGGQKAGAAPAGRKSLAGNAGRQSLAPAASRPSNARRSTLGSALAGQNNPNDKKSLGVKRRVSMPEPRPISDKQYMFDSSRKVVTFLTEKGYEEAITVKSLQSPAIKVYASILQFCFRHIDPTFTFKGQYDEEIPNMFRMLDYPMAIQKAELKVISQHHWPKLLAALTWLVDLIQYDETKAVLQSEESPMETEDTEGIFFDYLSATYRQFMDGIDDTSELDAKFSAQFEDKNRQIEEECSQLERANSVLQKDISRLEQHATQLPALRKQKNGLQDDLAKFTEFVSQLEAYEDKTQRKLAHFEKDLAAKKKRLEALQKEKEVLGGRLAEQIAAGIDCAKLMQEQRDLEEKLVQLREKKGMAGKMRGEQEIAMQKLLEVVESELRQYNELAMRLRLVPASANTKMPDVAFEVGFKSHARAEEMVSGDLAGTIKPALKVLRNQLSSNNRALAVELQSLQEEAERLTEQVEAKQEDVQMLQAKVEQQENALKAMKDLQEEDQKQLRQVAKAIRDETEALSKEGIQKLQNSHHAVDKLRAEENRLKSKIAAQEQELNNSIIEVIDRLTSHKQYIQNRLRELAEMAESTARHLAASEIACSQIKL